MWQILAQEDASCLGTLRENEVANVLDELIDSNVGALPCRAVLDFDGAVRKPTLAHHDLIREAHEVVVGELHARALGAVILPENWAPPATS